MALHELATNAAKYGALSNIAGRVYIDWNVTAVPVPTFTMQWREVGGPEVVAPGGTGFGQVVIGRMVEAAVGGTVALEIGIRGLTWELVAPAKKTLETGPDG